jgi:hypothetical protein
VLDGLPPGQEKTGPASTRRVHGRLVRVSRHAGKPAEWFPVTSIPALRAEEQGSQGQAHKHQDHRQPDHARIPNPVLHNSIKPLSCRPR